MAGVKRSSSADTHENIQALAKKIKDEEDSLIDGLYLNEETETMITRLFKIIDCNSDGCLDIKDFSLGNVFITPTGPLVEKWLEIRDKFDFDGDGQVTIDEFRRGFKKMVLKQTYQDGAVVTPKERTIEACIRALEKYVNDEVQELCQKAFTWYSQT